MGPLPLKPRRKAKAKPQAAASDKPKLPRRYLHVIPALLLLAPLAFWGVVKLRSARLGARLAADLRAHAAELDPAAPADRFPECFAAREAEIRSFVPPGEPTNCIWAREGKMPYSTARECRPAQNGMANWSRTVFPCEEGFPQAMRRFPTVSERYVRSEFAYSGFTVQQVGVGARRGAESAAEQRAPGAAADWCLQYLRFARHVIAGATAGAPWTSMREVFEECARHGGSFPAPRKKAVAEAVVLTLPTFLDEARYLEAFALVELSNQFGALLSGAQWHQVPENLQPLLALGWSRRSRPVSPVFVTHYWPTADRVLRGLPSVAGRSDADLKAALDAANAALRDSLNPIVFYGYDVEYVKFDLLNRRRARAALEALEGAVMGAPLSSSAP